MWIFHFPSEHSQVTDVVTFESGAICEEQMTFKPGGAEVLCCSASQQIPPPKKEKDTLRVFSAYFWFLTAHSLTEILSGLVVQAWSVTVSTRLERPSSSYSFSSMRWVKDNVSKHNALLPH